MEHFTRVFKKMPSPLLLGIGCWLFTNMLVYSATAQELAAVNPQVSMLEKDKEKPNQDLKGMQPLQDALTQLEKQYKVSIVGESRLLKDKFIRKDQLNKSNDTDVAHLDDLLNHILKPLGLAHKRYGKSFVIQPANEQKEQINKLEGKRIETRSTGLNIGDHQQVYQLPSSQPVFDKLQEKTITGTVVDENDEGLPGVNILVKNTTIGTVTDINGDYRLNAPDDATTLVFSSVGYTTEEVSIDNRSIINVSLVPDVQALSEIVVTAFGIEKEKKALSYSVQEVEGERLAAVGNTNVVNSIQGKVAGVTVKQTSGAPGSGSRITIRGSRSFVGNNEPLYVIDGMPISSDDRTIDINPNDIKSINVLKGPTAAALYGLRASNGVIVIETKKGQDTMQGKPSVTFETSYNFDQISMFPETQTTYGQGENGQFNPYSSFSWGPRIDTMGTYTNQLGEPEEAAVYDNDKELFQTGGTLNSNLGIAGNFDRGSYALNVGFANQEGILDNSDMQRINVKLAGGYDLADNLRVSSSINFVKNEVNRVDLPWWGTFSVPPSYNLAGKPTHEPGDPYQQINFRGQHDNLYWALDNNYINEKTARTFGNIFFDYSPLEWLSVNYRIGLDEYTTNIKDVNEKGSGSGRTDPPSGGSINNAMRTHRQINSNLNINLSHKFSEDFVLDFLLGNEFYDIRSNVISSSGQDIVVGGFHHISNTLVQTTNENLSRRRVVGFYGNLSLSWKNSVFLNATGRNDIVSNMPSGNRSFFYPSLGTGIVFTELFPISDNFLTFGKLRASLAAVGQAGPIHATATVFNAGSAAGGFSFPYQGLQAFTLGNQLNAADLEPENTSTFEIGMDLRFVNNRIGLDYTYYATKADNQIYRVPIATSTGYSSELRNAGEMSIKGHEVILNLKPVKTPSMLWDISINFSTFDNEVISLAEGIEELGLGGFRVQAVAREGEEYPSLRGWGYARDPISGDVVVDSRPTLPNGNPNQFYGMPLRATEQTILGSANPDFEFGFINNFSYKNFTLYAQLDWRQGGKLSSGYNRLGKLYGVLSETENREADYVFPGKKGFYDAESNLVVEGDNDVVIQQGFNFYRRNQDPINEASVYDATYVRLREVRLTYDFPETWLSNSFIRSVSFYLVGRNLWVNAAVPHFDPEMFSESLGEEYTTYPQTKSFGGGFRINF